MLHDNCALFKFFSQTLLLKINHSLAATWPHNSYMKYYMLTHSGQVTHICVGKLTVIGSDDSLSSGQRQAIIWTCAGKVSIGPLETNFSEILIRIQTFSFRKMHLKMSFAKWRPFSHCHNVFRLHVLCNDLSILPHWYYHDRFAILNVSLQPWWRHQMETFSALLALSILHW